MRTTTKFRMVRRVANIAILLGLLAFARTAFAQDDETAVSAVDTVWVLVAAFLVFFMQAGFGFLEAGFVRSKNVVNIMAENLMDTTMTTIGFILAGFGIMFGSGNAFFGTEWFLLSGLPDIYPGLSIPTLAFFFFQFAFCAAASTIASGLMAERTDFKADLAYSFFAGLIIYPVFGHWVWGGGWLAELGYLDFAGSSVVHLVGAYIGLAGTIMLGKRKDKVFGKSIRGHNIPLAALGTFILWLGWFGFNGGSTLKLGGVGVANEVANVFLNTNAAAAGGLIAAIILARILFGKADLTMALNGALAGLVAITAEPADPTGLEATLIGAAGGILVVLSIISLDKLKIDDPVGAISVHGVVGLWGVFAVLITDADATFMGQLIGALTIFVWVFAASLIVWFIIKMVIGIRVSEEEEYEGVDISECGMEAYPEFTKTT